MSREVRKNLTDYLIQAVVDNNVQQVGELLNRGADPNYFLDASQITALHHAAQNNSLEVIPLLIEAGAFLEAQIEPEGSTALEIAFLHGHDKVAQTLMAYLNKTDERLH